MEYARTIIAFLMLISASSFALPLTVSELAWPKVASGGPSGLTDLTNGLVGYWRFDTNNGVSAPFSGGIDYSASGRNLTAYGTPSYETGAVNTVVGSTVVSNSLSIDSNGYFAITNNQDFNLIGDRTFTMWILKRENGTAPGYYIFSQTDPSASPFNYVIGQSSATNLQFVVAGVGTIDTLVQTNQWLFVIAEYQHTNLMMTMQVNMGTVLTLSGGPATFSGVYSNWFGSLPVHAGSERQGLLDEVSAWNRMLLQIEKTNLYNLGAGRTYPFSP